MFTSLDKGVIDAADDTVFSANQAAGMHDVARHPVYPGFHSMPLVEVSITKATWGRMADDLQQLLEFSVSHLALDMTSLLSTQDLEAIRCHSWSLGRMPATDVLWAAGENSSGLLRKPSRLAWLVMQRPGLPVPIHAPLPRRLPCVQCTPFQRCRVVKNCVNRSRMQGIQGKRSPNNFDEARLGG